MMRRPQLCGVIPSKPRWKLDFGGAVLRIIPGREEGSVRGRALRWCPRDLGWGSRVEERCDQRVGCLELSPA